VNGAVFRKTGVVDRYWYDFFFLSFFPGGLTPELCPRSLHRTCMLKCLIIC